MATEAESGHNYLAGPEKEGLPREQDLALESEPANPRLRSVIDQKNDLLFSGSRDELAIGETNPT